MNQRNIAFFAKELWMVIIGGIFLLGMVMPMAAQTFSLKKASITGGGFLNDEAGIAAYVNVNQAIDLSMAKKVFRTVENETDTCLNGSVGIPDLDENQDAHVYVHKDGWIVAYYLNDEPVAKILNWTRFAQDKTVRPNNLDVVIGIICNSAGLPIPKIKYYDFKYPHANRIVFIADANDAPGDNSFNVKLPSNFVFFERSISHYSHTDGNWGAKSELLIDGAVLDKIAPPDHNWKYQYKTINPTTLSIDEFHTVNIKNSDSSLFSCGVLVLVYQEP